LQRIIEASGPDNLEDVRLLFREYSGSIGISLCFQGFEEELATLPGRYAPPRGAILVTLVDGEPAGCVAMRPLNDPGICEMKRLYVRPGHRGLKFGAALLEAIVQRAREAGYRAMRLDTLPSMERAIAMYERFGFKDIEPYCQNPHEGVRYLELALRDKKL